MRCQVLLIVIGVAAVGFGQPKTPAPATVEQSRAVTLNGKALDSKDQPLRKTTITLRLVTPNAGKGYATTSDQDGSFSFTDVAPGRYSLTAERAGYLWTTYGARNNSSGMTILNLAAGKEVAPITVRLTEQSVVSGKVVDDDGDPSARAQVKLMRLGYLEGRRQPAVVRGAAANDSGEFRIIGVPAGQYYLRADPRPVTTLSVAAPPSGATAVGPPDERSIPTYYPNAAEIGASTLIDVPAGETIAGMNIHLRKSRVFHVRGKFVGADAEMSEYRTYLIPRPATGVINLLGPGKTNKDGTFDMTGIPPDSYMMIAVKGNDFHIFGRRTLEVTKQDVDGIDLPVHPLPSLLGAVKIEGGAAKLPPGLGVGLSVTEGPDFDSPNAAVKEDGTFALNNVAAGKYRVQVTGTPPGFYLKSVSFGAHDALESGIDVGLDKGNSSLQVVLSGSAAEISGTVVTDEKTPAPGSTVTLIPDPPRPEQAYLYQMANTDQDGQFSFRSVRPGKYRIYAWEELESDAQYDPETLKANKSRGLPVVCVASDKKKITLTQIPVSDPSKAPAVR